MAQQTVKPRCSRCERVHTPARVCLPNSDAACPTCADLGVVYAEAGSAWACPCAGRGG